MSLAIWCHLYLPQFIIRILISSKWLYWFSIVVVPATGKGQVIHVVYDTL